MTSAFRLKFSVMSIFRFDYNTRELGNCTLNDMMNNQLHARDFVHKARQKRNTGGRYKRLLTLLQNF